MKYKIALIVLSLGMILKAQFYEYQNLSQSSEISRSACVRTDAYDQFHTVWVDEYETVFYRGTPGGNWGTAIPVYYATGGNTVTHIRAEVLNDTCFVAFNNNGPESAEIIVCSVFNNQLVHTDTIETITGSVYSIRSAKTDNEIAFGYSYAAENENLSLRVYTHPQKISRPVISGLTESIGKKFALSYDHGDSLWVFYIADNVWSRFLAPQSETWSERLMSMPCDYPLEALDCDYNQYSQRFNMLLLSQRASCMDCIENKLMFSKGYGSNWSDCEEVDPGGSTFKAQGSFDTPFIVLQSNGTVQAFYKYNYSSDMSDDEYSVRQAVQNVGSSSWNVTPALQFSTPDFTLTSATANSNDSLFFTYQKAADVYLAAQETHSTIEKIKHNPYSYHLFPCFPNPFNPVTTISYYLPVSGTVRMSVYDMTGKVICILVNQKQATGFHSVQWKADNVSGGIYFYRLETGQEPPLTGKMVLLK